MIKFLITSSGTCISSSKDVIWFVTLSIVSSNGIFQNETDPKIGDRIRSFFCLHHIMLVLKLQYILTIYLFLPVVKYKVSE